VLQPLPYVKHNALTFVVLGYMLNYFICLLIKIRSPQDVVD
jgi:hypothetical protein